MLGQMYRLRLRYELVKDMLQSDIYVNLQKYSTNVEGIFAAGDCRRGQSLIVWGIKYVPFSLFCLHLSQCIVTVRVVVLQQRSTGGSVAVLVGYHLLVELILE
jgi:NADPH-dependent glutamate synthase beta subunit-like oxidoreductase